ncbi:MAG: menaquinone biosynthesis decarboxylase [Thermodesulfobacteriota bacterium]|nr:menaquinone biosynthesis decarboxylase [Thermodesulfobacteriota bacterium]|tara:strand:+ start:35931 stop:37700 length:1770 start_codon:yes stop_codon:yes gene_type:complete
MSQQKFNDLGTYIDFLDRIGDLKRIKSEVDPILEISEISCKTIESNGPALLFENVKGSTYPVATNLFGSEERLRLSLGCNPKELGEEIVDFAEKAMPPSLGNIFNSLPFIKRVTNFRTKKVSLNSPCQQVEDESDLDSLPIIKCWPDDGGRFITMGLTISESPKTSKRNMGMYRLQVHDKNTLGVHWHPHKGGAAHYHEACGLGVDFPIAVVLGGDPSLIFAAIAPLPDNIDELLFAGFLKKKPVELCKTRTSNLRVPSNAEFIIEGTVPLNETKLEGPFGDHFGYYSMESQFPFLNIKTITRKHNAIFPATVVGRPPKEDMYLGMAATHIFGPLIRLVNPEIIDLWAYYEAGFHNLLVVSVDERYPKNSVKCMMSIWGTGQLSLTKCIITVPSFVNPENLEEVFGYLGANFNPSRDLTLLQTTPLDTLDFTSGKMHVGSKVGFNAIGDGREISKDNFNPVVIRDPRIACENIRNYKVINKNIIVISSDYSPEKLIEEIFTKKILNDFKIIFLVSMDIRIEDNVDLLWGIFTRFDPSIDIHFQDCKRKSSTVTFEGQMIVDATFKSWYPKVIEMDKDISSMVNEKWKTY